MVLTRIRTSGLANHSQAVPSVTPTYTAFKYLIVTVRGLYESSSCQELLKQLDVPGLLRGIHKSLKGQLG